MPFAGSQTRDVAFSESRPTFGPGVAEDAWSRKAAVLHCILGGVRHFVRCHKGAPGFLLWTKSGVSVPFYNPTKVLSRSSSVKDDRRSRAHRHEGHNKAQERNKGCIRRQNRR